MLLCQMARTAMLCHAAMSCNLTVVAGVVDERIYYANNDYPAG
jgi:hypothetical protein